MLKLCGFAASNYYNKVKLALLEKGIPFEEELAWVGQTDPAASPLGKVPYLKTDEGNLSESTVLLEYIEAKYPQHPLLPADPFAAAKVGFAQSKTATINAAIAAGKDPTTQVVSTYHGGLVPPFCNAAARGFFSQF